MKNFWKNKNILITGGAGFIGTHLANNLVREKAIVTVVDNLERGTRKNLDKKIKFEKLDLRNLNSSLNNIFKKKDFVFHLASKVGSMQYYLKNSFEVFHENLLIDNNVIDLCLKFKIKNFFYASSAHVYPSEKTLIKKSFVETDDYPYRPSISYGFAKMITESKLLYATKKFEFFNVISGRYTGIYGPHQDYDVKTASFIPAICGKIINGQKKLKLLTNGKEKRSYCFIDDAIDCTKLICQKRREKFEVFNISSNSLHTIKKISKIIIKCSEKKVNLITPKIKANIDYQFCSSAKAQKTLKWKPKIDLEKGIMFTYEDLLKRIKKK